MDGKDEIKDRLSVEEVIGEYLELKPSGRNLKALSPFTAEKTPSFMVSPDKQIWHDFSSNKGGDIFTFVMEVEGVDFKEALQILASKAGVDLAQYSKNVGSKSSSDLKKQLIEAHKLSVDFYQRALIKNTQALEYLKNRNLTKETILEFGIGYAPDEFDALLKFLQKKGYSENQLLQAGLIKKSNGKVFDTFRGRITVPLCDGVGNYIGFTARLLNDKPNAPKYLNTPSTILYDKSKHLYGLHFAKDAIREESCTVIVEGNFDVVTSHQAGIRNVVASAGTALTSQHIKQVERLSRNIKLAFDSDRAGVEATERAITLASKHKINLQVITVDEGKDPDELIQKDPKLWQSAIRKSSEVFDWLLGYYQQQFDISKVSGKKALSDKMVGVLRQIDDPVELDDYVAKLAKVLAVSNEAIYRKFEQEPVSKKRYKKVKASDQQHDTGDIFSRRLDDLLVMLIADSSLVAKTPDYHNYFNQPQKNLWQFLSSKQKLNTQDLPPSLLSDEQYVTIQVFKAEQLYNNTDSTFVENAIKALVKQLDELIKKQKQQPLEQALKEAEQQGDTKKAQQIIKQLNAIIKGEVDG